VWSCAKRLIFRVDRPAAIDTAPCREAFHVSASGEAATLWRALAGCAYVAALLACGKDSKIWRKGVRPECSRGLHRLDDMLRPATMSAMISDMLTASMAKHARTLVENNHFNGHPDLIEAVVVEHYNNRRYHESYRT
jgi:hypothetical protein